MVNSITAQLGRLSVSLPRISVRLLSTKKKQAKRGWIDPEFPEGHMEKIWVWTHMLNGLTVYSPTPVLKANRALKQIPFNGKNLKPSKLRKDYWRPLLMIQFPTGHGATGQSVYGLLRQMRTLHELSWGDEVFWNESKNRARSKRQRGMVLNNQKANTIADVAAILSGVGKGNKMWRAVGELEVAERAEAEKQAEIKAAEQAEVDSAKQTEPENNGGSETKAVESSQETRTEEKKDEGAAESASEPSSLPISRVDPKTGMLSELIPIQLFWTHLDNMNHAQEWSGNVQHFEFPEAQLEQIRQANDKKQPEGKVIDEPPSEEELLAENDPEKKAKIIERQVLENHNRP